MERIKHVLVAVKATPELAAGILGAALDADRDAVVAGLAAFVVAALDGVVPDPEKL